MTNELYHYGVKEMTNELYHYNHNHDPLGRFAKSSGVSRSERLGKRKDRLENRSLRYEARIALDKEKLSRTSSLRRDAKVAKLERKKNRYAPRAAKAQKRLAKGKDISNRQAKAMLKTQQLNGKIAKVDQKNSKTRARIAKNEVRNARVEKRIARVSKMQMRSLNREQIRQGQRIADQVIYRADDKFTKKYDGDPIYAIYAKKDDPIRKDYYSMREKSNREILGKKNPYNFSDGQRIYALKAQGYTDSEISKVTGISKSTIEDITKKKR